MANSVVIDPDHHAEFLNTHYQKLLPTTGRNQLKNSLTKFMVEYAKQHTAFHIIACNANRSVEERGYLLQEIYPPTEFLRIVVHFDLPQCLLQERIKTSQRSTAIFRSAAAFEEVLARQQQESKLGEAKEPSADEADYLFVIRRPEDKALVIQELIVIAGQ